MDPAPSWRQVASPAIFFLPVNFNQPVQPRRPSLA